MLAGKYVVAGLKPAFRTSTMQALPPISERGLKARDYIPLWGLPLPPANLAGALDQLQKLAAVAVLIGTDAVFRDAERGIHRRGSFVR